MIRRPSEPYFESTASLRALFEQTQALKAFFDGPGNPDDWKTRQRLKHEMLTELWGDPLPKPANMASGWRLMFIASDAVEQILIAHGLLPPEPSPKPTLWQRLRTALYL